jgi:Zn-dependent peptidase ImmA (M78 family)
MTFYQKRFTICHEIWHYYYWDIDSTAHHPDKEKRSDNFAIDVLIPAEELIEQHKKYGKNLKILEKIFWVERKIIEERIKQIFNI